MRTWVRVLLAGVLVGGAAGAARADQLQCNSQADAERAVALLPAGSVMIDYCSACTDPVEVVYVRAARAVKDCDFEVEVEGGLVARSEGSYSGRLPKAVRYRLTDEAYRKRVDLAYAYVETGPNQFSWLGGVLGLRAQVPATTVQLPDDLYRRIGQHTLPAVPAKAVPVPRKFKIAPLGFAHFSQPGVREAVRAFDAGDFPGALKAAEGAVDSLLTQLLSGRLPGFVKAGSLRELLAGALQERLDQGGYSPMRGIGAGRELLAIEKLPLDRLERAVAVMAVWAGAQAEAWGKAEAVRAAAQSLLTGMETLADLYRRSPRAAALAQFYAVLYLRAVVEEGTLDPDALIVARRLKQYFEDERGSFQGNYARVLEALLR